MDHDIITFYLIFKFSEITVYIRCVKVKVSWVKSRFAVTESNLKSLKVDMGFLLVTVNKEGNDSTFFSLCMSHDHQ